MQSYTSACRNIHRRKILNCSLDNVYHYGSTYASPPGLLLNNYQLVIFAANNHALLFYSRILFTFNISNLNILLSTRTHYLQKLQKLLLLNTGIKYSRFDTWKMRFVYAV